MIAASGQVYLLTFFPASAPGPSAICLKIWGGATYGGPMAPGSRDATASLRKRVWSGPAHHASLPYINSGQPAQIEPAQRGVLPFQGGGGRATVSFRLFSAVS